MIPPATSLDRILTCLLDGWPEHERYLMARFRDPSDVDHEDALLLSELILKIADGDPTDLCKSYRWMCDEFLEAQLNFSRTLEYRRSSFAEVEAEVYANAPYMANYMRGLLLSQLLWTNHARAFSYLRRKYFPRLAAGFRHLEIGPGHGLFLHLAARTGVAASIEGWDVSRASLEQTRLTLGKLGDSSSIQLNLRDAVNGVEEGVAGRFNSIVISEVLEHLEKPAELLTSVRRLLAPGGRIFINVPVNSPAPDHIFLLRSPEAARSLVEKANYRVDDFEAVPMTGKTVEEARRSHATISCLMVATT